MTHDLLDSGRITDEGLEELRRRSGKKLSVSRIILNELVSKETIRRFVNGIGDVNSLWNDEEYAKKTRYGTLVAPPNYLYSVMGYGVHHGLPGVQSFHAGDDWEFYKPILLGDKITPEFIGKGYEEMRESKIAARMIKQLDERRFYNQRGELVAKCDVWVMRTERSSIREKKRESTIQLPQTWTEEALKKIEEEVLSEEIRGAQIRYWEDVKEDEELPALVKGPLGITDMLAWLAGASSSFSAHGRALRIYRKHPSWAFRDPDTGALEPILAVHYNKRAANSAGVPYPYDVGIQRNAWLIQFYTNWMGDEGWLKSCYAEYRKFVYLSDVVWLRGKVTRKYVDDAGECCVEIKTAAFNQRGENVMPGWGVVSLPSREAGNWPVERRLLQASS